MFGRGRIRTHRGRFRHVFAGGRPEFGRRQLQSVPGEWIELNERKRGSDHTDAEEEIRNAIGIETALG